MAFSRPGYRECTAPAELARWKSSLDPQTRDLIQKLESSYPFTMAESFLSLASYKKCLATIWLLEEIYQDSLCPKKERGKIVEPACQDFSRSFALHQFYSKYFGSVSLTGVEVDAFPPLSSLHSRFDIARHFCQHVPHSRYVATDFFHWTDSSNIICLFYPFVSPHPAIAWGLPHKFGDPQLWLRAISRSLVVEGQAIVVHQGPWEEEEFDEVGDHFPDLQLITRKILVCPFIPAPHPAHVSLYKKKPQNQ